MILVGLGHRLGVGKDAVAKILVERYGFVRRGFADSLKEEVLATMPRTLDAIAQAVFTGRYVTAKERGQLPVLMRELVYELKPPIIRAFLQEWGTELRRAEDSEYWIRRVAEWVDRQAPDARIVFTDLRFRNEVEFVKDRGGYLVRVDRDLVRLGEASTHESEQDPGQGRWEFIIPNHGTLEDLTLIVGGLARYVGLN